MLATPFDAVFVVPVASRPTRPAVPSRNYTVDDLEFSNFGRSAQQNVAWVFLGLACFWSIIAFLALAASELI